MPVIVVGLNHKTAPISLLGELSISADELPKALHQLATYEHVLEGAVLSTCNRSEVYAFVTKFHGGAQDLRNFLAEFCHVAPEEFNDHLYTYHDDAAARHLFRVAAGIDSMLVGESEILGQVKHAYQAAGEEQMIHRVLGRAFQQALKVGKQARTDTSIGRNPVSVSSAAVELARRTFGAHQDSLRDKRVLIVGAGKMGHLTMRSLARAGASDVTVVNRTEERAHSLAEGYGATPLPFDQLENALGRVEIVISSTTSPESVMDRSMIERVVAARARDRPLMIIDIAVPGDVEEEVGDVEGILVRRLEDLRQIVDANLGGRRGEISKVEDIVSKEVDRFVTWERSTEIAPTVAKLVKVADEVRSAEMMRLANNRAGMTDEQLQAVDHMSRRIIAKLLHVPIKRAKRDPSSKQGQMYLSTLTELFDLDDDV